MNNLPIAITPDKYIAKSDIPALQELVLNPQTKQQGLAIINQVCMLEVTQQWIAKIDRYNEHKEINKRLIQQNSDIIDPVTGHLDWLGFCNICRQYFNEYVTIGVDGNIHPNWIRLFLEFFNIPADIKEMSLGVKIYKKNKEMQKKFYNDPQSKFYLKRQIDKAIEYIDKQAEDEKFYKRMRALGSKDFFSNVVSTASELGSILDEFGKDAKDLNELISKQNKILIKRGEI